MTTVAQDTKNTNTLAQTFNCTYSGAPTEGNLLIAFLFHDETSTDIATITSSGWTRVGTAVGSLSSVSYRISIWAKYAGAAESTTVAFDIGEVNRRAHGYAVEYTGAPLTPIPATDSALVSQGVVDSGATSNQVDDLVNVAAVQFAVAMIGLNGTSTTTPSWAGGEVTENEDWSNNFRASAIGYIDGPVSDVQPTASWGTSRASIQAVFVLGAAPDPLVIKARSSFQVIKS